MHHIVKMYTYKGHKRRFHTFKTVAMDGTGLLHTPNTLPPEKDVLKSFLSELKVCLCIMTKTKIPAP